MKNSTDIQNISQNKTESDIIDKNNANEFKIERYKYILQELHFLNESVHKNLNLFQTLATAIIGSGIFLFVSWREFKIDAQTARLGIQGLLGLLVIITCYVTLIFVATIISWFDYRKEEVEVLNEIIGSGFRKLPTLNNFWRWSETYVIIFIIFTVIMIYLFVELKIIPRIN